MNNTQNITLENKNNTLLGQIFHLLADVADGKISLDDAIKQTTNDHKQIKKLKNHYHNFDKFVMSLKKNIKKEIHNAQIRIEFEHNYDSQSALSIRDEQGNIKGFIGGKPKTKQSLWHKIKHRFSRSLRQHADFIDGKMSLKEFTQTPLKNLHQDYMDDSKLYRQSTGIIQGINKGIKQSIAELRGTAQPNNPNTTSLPPSPQRLYDSLDNTQFAVALGTAYENLVRIQHDGYRSEADKKELMTEFKYIINSAHNRYPHIQPTTNGSYFKDKDFADIEAKLFPYLKEAGKNDTVIIHDTKRYEAWRNNQPFTEMNITEQPFHNSARYSSQSSSHYHTTNSLISPLKAGQNTMSEQQLQQTKAQIAKMTVR